MKRSDDPRHLKRVKIMQSLFSYAFQKDAPGGDQSIMHIIPHLSHIDSIIAESAPVFPVERIAHVDLAILRLAIYELVIEKKNPPKVITDEAIELAKAFGADASSAFVNGVLGSVLAKKETYGSYHS